MITDALPDPRVDRFKALGGEVTVQAEGAGADEAVIAVQAVIGELHNRLTRFDPRSELCLLNADPRTEVPASPLMIRFVDTVIEAGRRSNGLVDATLLDQVEAAGYVGSIDPDNGETEFMSSTRGEARPGNGDWRRIRIDHDRGMVIRPPGVRLDSGGLGKGLAADLATEILGHLESWAVVCAGDLRFGGTAGVVRQVDVAHPVPGEGPIASCASTASAVATSGITRRSWHNEGGLAHHLIDPRTGRPAETGLIQVTALAPTAVEAEIRAKAALLSGPDRAHDILTGGGVVVTDAGRVIARGFQVGS
jgi:thiamine biosynthesis lipoprotein